MDAVLWVAYGIGACAWLIGWGVRLEDGPRYDRRRSATMMLATPVWPPLAVLGLLYQVWVLIQIAAGLRK